MLTRSQTTILAGCVALTPLAIDMYLPAMPALAADLRISAQQAAQSVSVFLVGISAGQLVAGPLSDRFGRRLLIIGGLALFSSAAVLAALTSSFALLLIARLLQALGACAVMVSGRAVARDLLSPVETARLFSLLSLIGGMAPVLAPALGAAIVRLGDWRVIFLVMAGFGASLIAFVAWFLPESRSAETAANARAEHPFRAYWTLITNRALWGFMLTAALNGAAFFSYIANSATVLVNGYGLSPEHFSMLFALNAIGLIAANQINRHLLKTRRLASVLRSSARNALLLAPLLLVFALTGWGGLYALLALLFLMTGSTAPIQANSIAAGLGIDGLRAGSAAALFGAITFASGAGASWIASLLYDGTGRGLALVIGLCVLASAAAIFAATQEAATR